MSVPEYPDSTHEDTDPDAHLSEDPVACTPLVSTGEAIPRQCPVCDAGLPSGMALFRHLRSAHPTDRPYSCHDCDHSFNNLRKLSSHHSNVHCAQKVSCKHCEYTTMTHTKMRQHVLKVSVVLNVGKAFQG